MRTWPGTCFAVAGALVGSVAHAHVSISSGPAFAGAPYEATFNISHGCEGADTFQVEVRIPDGVVAVRPMDSVFGKAVVVKDPGDGKVKAVVWTKAPADVLPEDSQLYKFTLRATLPDAPFTTLFFPTIQHCRKADGTESMVQWVGATTGHDHDASGGTPPAEEPAPALFVLPQRSPGWNRYTVGQHVHDLTVFADAQIVWAGNAAYSPNPSVQELIAQEPDTQPLTVIHPGTEIWVKY